MNEGIKDALDAAQPPPLFGSHPIASDLGGPQKVKHVDIHGMVELLTRLPDRREMLPLRARLSGIANEMAVTSDPAAADKALDDLRGISHISDLVDALRGLIGGKTQAVGKLCTDVLSYWNQHMGGAEAGPAAQQQRVSTNSRLQQRRAGDEQSAWDLINSQD